MRAQAAGEAGFGGRAIPIVPLPAAQTGAERSKSLTDAEVDLVTVLPVEAIKAELTRQRNTTRADDEPTEIGLHLTTAVTRRCKG